MWSFFKKDLLVFWRDRKEVLIALLLPILLITILDVALSGIFSNEKEPIELKVGIVIEDQHEIGLQQFKESMDKSGLSLEEQEAVLGQATAFEPSKLISTYLTSPELKDWMQTKELTEKKAKEQVEDGKLDAYVKIPEGFSYEVLSAMMLGEEANVALSVHAERQSTDVITLQTIIETFIDSINLQFALGSGVEDAGLEPVLPQGGIEVLEGVQTYSFTQYITIGMCTLFALFMAQTLAMKTVTEKRERVFNRILLSNSHPLQFLMGKILASFSLIWFQMMLNLSFSHLLFGTFSNKSGEFLGGLLVMLTVFSLTIAGLSALFTSISLTIHDTNAMMGLSSFIIMTMGVLGGSFSHIEILPDYLQAIGEWTPNGLTLTAIIEWIQVTNVETLTIPIIVLLVMFIVLVAVAMTIFPRRGRY